MSGGPMGPPGLEVFTEALIRSRVPVRVRVETLRGWLPVDPDQRPLTGHLTVELDQGFTAGVHLTFRDPVAAEDLATALKWAANRLREQLAAGQPAQERRTFTPPDPDHDEDDDEQEGTS